MDNNQKLLEIYRENPCMTLPNAFWKTAMQMDESRLSIRRDSTGELSALALWRESDLMAFWCAHPEDHILSPKQLAQVPFVLTHAASLPVFNNREFSHRVPFFRILHRGSPKIYKLPQDFMLKNVQPESEIDAVAAFVRICYKNININSKIVRSWLNHPVYDPNLWVWILNEKTGQPAGLGIAELDKKIPEASLEWIQIHPNYQQRGLGSALVSELLRRVSDKVEFTTVSGKIDSPNYPEKLYRQCGFTGSDVWWLLKS